MLHLGAHCHFLGVRCKGVQGTGFQFQHGGTDLALYFLLSLLRFSPFKFQYRGGPHHSEMDFTRSHAGDRNAFWAGPDFFCCCSEMPLF